jgi:hypothetical protein
MDVYEVENSNNEIKIVPNPAQSSNFIKIKTQYPIETILIFNLFGKLCKTVTNSNQFSINSLDTGIYCVRIISVSGNIESHKLVIH